MSDGPHRSLPMRPGWKRVAERAYNRNFDPNQITEAVLSALAKDCRMELSDTFLSSLRGIYDTLLKDNLSSQLEALRGVAGPGLGRSVLDHAIHQSAAGATATAEQALASALVDRNSRCARQVDELYRRALKNRSTIDMRARIEQAGGGIAGLARQVLKMEPKTTRRTPPKHQDLDDGVAL
jgi:superfamily II RNA helicase